ncbi:MAG: DUF1707 domain-containing protein [Kibdelosporangium sp.]
MGQARFMNVRIGDAERDESVTLLAEHFAKGRLSPAEHEERRAAAKAAILRGEIEDLFADLPKPHPDMSGAQPPVPAPVPAQPKLDTPLSNFLIGMGAVTFLLGVPAWLVLGIVVGLWWLIAPVLLVTFGFFIASDMAMKPRLQD